MQSKIYGGRGVLLSGIAGVKKAKIVIVGLNAAQIYEFIHYCVANMSALLFSIDRFYFAFWFANCSIWHQRRFIAKSFLLRRVKYL
ncbi:hypothetical protein OQH60_00750 [Campylobacter sp. MIT 21-1685]|uniref:hypothetical protein n=1 Tax=unclassified Campylobacter TaxID=2593542 RepID=UPI00224AB962|nr:MULTISPECIES: hypothetical protein [unclassified Campylobacter]MCX2682284.1 hypothetical protein [Campylobacter sp. MIT 21-1684]MCX2750564.1 hypothetical protein [Campylobacter sp. MIT 21-1682]MCX2806888.1 hypothetical protein [Campylobacter sp. MIT 21-1685]